ncbi:hypothetical protein V865_005286 [Kwoniella europaea PYCC6329]|uniref:Uncharacterized protein n=1 Tax=Kwoniella europaea PYCC6329 TaxID=1423913 RepID=A0AAX4KLZ3_9TREE
MPGELNKSEEAAREQFWRRAVENNRMPFVTSKEGAKYVAVAGHSEWKKVPGFPLRTFNMHKTSRITKKTAVADIDYIVGEGVETKVVVIGEFKCPEVIGVKQRNIFDEVMVKNNGHFVINLIQDIKKPRQTNPKLSYSDDEAKEGQGDIEQSSKVEKQQAITRKCISEVGDKEGAMNVSNFVVHQDHPSTDSDESTLSQLLTGLPLYAFQQTYDVEDFPKAAVINASSEEARRHYLPRRCRRGRTDRYDGNRKRGDEEYEPLPPTD